MASMLARNFTSALKKTFLPRVTPCIKHYSEMYPPYYDPAEGKEASKDIEMPDEYGGAVGIERWELLQKAKGISDPFGLQGMKITPGTKDKPTLIPTIEPNRVVGCICEEDAVVINYIHLHAGETKRCQCGHWFKLVPLQD